MRICNKADFCKIVLLVLIHFWGVGSGTGVGAYLSLRGRGGGVGLGAYLRLGAN